MPRQTLIQVRRGSQSDWIAQNPILSEGEFGFETDTNRLKIGNGYSNWKNLEYIGSAENYIKIKNQTGYALNKGQAVYISGFDSNSSSPTVELYIANGQTSEQKFAGLVSSYIPNGESGSIITFGILSGIDTTGSISNIALGDENWSNGDILYVSSYDYGKLTINKPSKNIILVGIILYSNNTGSILVRSFINPKFDQLNGITINNPLDNNLLKYNNASDTWFNSNDIDCGSI